MHGKGCKIKLASYVTDGKNRHCSHSMARSIPGYLESKCTPDRRFGNFISSAKHFPFLIIKYPIYLQFTLLVAILSKMATRNGLGPWYDTARWVRGGADKVLGLCNTGILIIAILTFQSYLHVLAHCAVPCCTVPTLSYMAGSCTAFASLVWPVRT